MECLEGLDAKAAGLPADGPVVDDIGDVVVGVVAVVDFCQKS